MTELIQTTFNFQDSVVRVIGEQDTPMFIAKDICDILELSNVSHALKNIPEKWKSITESDTGYGVHEMLTISEPGLYKLIMRSNQPIAQNFQEWVCEDVLPSIRKNGDYKLQQELESKEQEIKQLNTLLKRKLRKTHKKGNCVYLVKNPDIEGKYKLGSTSDIDRRLQDYGGASPHEYELLHSKYIPQMKQVEDLLLYIFDKHRCESAYKGSKKREWLELDPDTIITEINGLCEYIQERKQIYDPDHTNEPVEESKTQPEPIQTKTCVTCSEVKIIEDFYDRSENVDGKEGVCKECFVKRQLLQREKKRLSLLQNKTKKCRKCKIINPLSMYKELCTSKDGHSYICSNCSVKPVVHKLDKTCSMCKVEKPVKEFNKCRTSVDGYFGYCRPCTKIKNKEYKNKVRKK